MKTINTKLQLKNSTNHSSRTTIVGNLFFIIGTCIVLATLIYMLGNLDKADSITTIWMLCMVIGLLLWVAGLIIKHMKMWMK